jgi:hypothetical protein
MNLTYHAKYARVAAQSRERARKTGYVGHNKLWSEAEHEIVRKLAPDYDAMEKALNRTRGAIGWKCAQMGLRKPAHQWTAAEISRLRKLYPSGSIKDLCEAFPHSSIVNIRYVARYHGMRRSRKPYKATGIPLLDEIRLRCFEIGWTMIDLDKAAKTKKYFRKSEWFGKNRINYKHLGRAIEALDGFVQAEWREYDD